MSTHTRAKDKDAHCGAIDSLSEWPAIWSYPAAMPSCKDVDHGGVQHMRPLIRHICHLTCVADRHAYASKKTSVVVCEGCTTRRVS